MGEVYRARDTRLDRTVAIKILPAQLSSDPVRKQRFEREAKAISSLNHPHICVLHDIGHQDGVDYLVMECVEGGTLAKRLEKGPLPLEQVLKYGAQVADALDKAHRNGVVHRDLKPGNIMLTPTGAKLLDFGLAKQVIPLNSGVAITVTAHTPVTPSSPVTQEGTIVGTFQYMSPEQIEGKDLDGRSDIFSLGAVLYEMAAGKSAFEGKTQFSVASAILEKEPAPIAAANPSAPPALGHVIRKCLAKNPDDRWQSAADIKHELDWIAQSSSDGSSAFAALSKSAPRTRALSYVLLAAGVLAGVAVGAAVAYFAFGHSAPQPVIRASLPPSDITVITLGDEAGAQQISPDGTNLVFVGVADARRMLFLRSMDTGTVKPLPGTEGGKFPFWSPDGRSVGFFADQQLKRVDIAGGPAMTLAPAADARGGSWGGDNIIYSPYIYESLYRVPASGGKPVAVTSLDRSQFDTHRFPRFLPDGKHFIYLAANHQKGEEGNSAILAGSIDGGPAKLLIHAETAAIYSSGELLYYRDGSLMAQPFDTGSLTLSGEPTAIGPVLRETGNWGLIASASQNGVLLFQNAGNIQYHAMWFDKTGHTVNPAPILGELQALRVSPDGARAATVRFDGPSGSVYVTDLKTGSQTRLTFSGRAWYVVFSPDGNKVAYSTEASSPDKTEVYIKRSDGSGGAELLLSSGNLDHPTDWTRDGKYLVFERGPMGSSQIWVLPLFGDRKPFRLLPNASYDHSDARVSPDGKWIAYYASETGRPELYVTSFPGGSGQWQVSTNGFLPGPTWGADGKELYFISEDGNLVAAPIRESAGSVAIDEVKPLFRSPFVTSLQDVIFDVDPKGDRFLGDAAPDTSALPLNLITNWTAELRNK